LLQVTETGVFVVAVPPVKIWNPPPLAEARHVASTVAETSKETLAVAATAGLSAKPATRIPKTNTGKAPLMAIALPPSRKTADGALIGSS
jgi:hypothetical protein